MNVILKGITVLMVFAILGFGLMLVSLENGDTLSPIIIFKIIIGVVIVGGLIVFIPRSNANPSG